MSGRCAFCKKTKVGIKSLRGRCAILGFVTHPFGACLKPRMFSSESQSSLSGRFRQNGYTLFAKTDLFLPWFGPSPESFPCPGGVKGRETVGRRKLFVAINEYLLWTYGRFVVDLHRRNENASFYVRQVDADEAFVGLFKKSHIFLLEESD